MIASITYQVTLDASVLINFLVIDRLDLLGNLPQHRFYVTEHVEGEITYTGQQAVLATAIQSGTLTLLPPGTHEETATFAILTDTFGLGESAAIAAAMHRSMKVGLEDKAARRVAESHLGQRNVLSTVEIFVGIIHAGLLTVSEADAIKGNWAANHRFALPHVKTFGELI